MANNIIKRVWNQNRMVNIEDLSGAAFQAENGGHTFEISGIDDTGNAVALSGTVAGVFRRPDNADIALTGTASGGVVSVTLTTDCYAVPGRFGLTIFTTANSQKTCVYAGVGTVAQTSGGGVAGDTPQDVVDLINAIEAAVATIPADYTDLMAAIAPTYSSSSLYAVGSYAWYDGDLYRCTSPITTAETWTAAHWTAAVLGNDVVDLKSAISLSQNLVPKSTLTPNPRTVNGVTVTALGPGKLHLSGTASGTFAIDHYDSNSTLPFGMVYGASYYAVAIGGIASVSRVYSYGATATEIYKIGDTWGKFTAPQSGGLRIRTTITGGVTYDETVEVVIIKDNVYTKGIANFDDLAENQSQTNTLLTESNLPINYATISTATKTHNGLTFSAVNGTVTVNGTSTGVAFYDFFRLLTNPEEFPLKAGHTYALRFADETLTPLIYKQVVYAESSSSGETTLYSKQSLSDYIVFTVPDTLYDFYVRLVCDRSGATYTSKTISFSIEEITGQKDVIVVDVNGGGDFTSLKAGIEYAMLKYGTKVIVKRGTYDLVTEFGKSYLDSLSGNDYGIMLGNGIELEFAPNAYVSFVYDGTNDWVIANFSPFNTANDLGYTIDGLHCTAHNCRYILHDDPRPGVKDRYSKNVIRNCYFELFPSTEYSSWVNHQIIGGGLGDSTMVEIENCIFNDHYSGVSSYSSVSYHNSTSGSAEYESRIIVKDCYFMDGNNLTFEGYGSSTKKTKVIATNNSLENGDASIIYSNTNADNMILYKWNNHARN